MEQTSPSPSGINSTFFLFACAAGVVCGGAGRLAGYASPTAEAALILLGAGIGGAIGAGGALATKNENVKDNGLFGVVGGAFGSLASFFVIDSLLNYISNAVTQAATNAAQQAAAQVTTAATPVPTAATTQAPVAETPRSIGTVIRNYFDASWCSTTEVAKSPDGRTIYSLGGRISDTLSNNVLNANPTIPGLENTCDTVVGPRADAALYKASLLSDGEITLTQIDASSITHIWDGVWKDICNNGHCCYDNTCYGLKYYYTDVCNGARCYYDDVCKGAYNYYDCIHGYVSQTIQPYYNPPPHPHPPPHTPVPTPEPTHIPPPTHVPTTVPPTTVPPTTVPPTTVPPTTVPPTTVPPTTVPTTTHCTPAPAGYLQPKPC